MIYEKSSIKFILCLVYMYPISCLFVQVVVKYKPENLQNRSDKNFEPHYDNLPMQYTEMFFIFKNEKMKKNVYLFKLLFDAQINIYGHVGLLPPFYGAWLS